MIDLSIKLPDGFLDEEMIDGFLVTSTQKEVWAVELDLLKQLMDVCDRHQIQFFMSGGSLLGTIRHHGFIPWDDDIDVIMSRSDYNRLCRIAAGEFSEPYFFQTEYTDPGSLRGHAQLRNSNTTGILRHEEKYKYKFNQGIFIDILPFDNYPSNAQEQLKFAFNGKKLKSLAERYAAVSTRYTEDDKSHTSPIKKAINTIVGKRFSFNIFYWVWERYMQKYKDSDCDLVSLIVWWGASKKLIWKKEWYRSAVIKDYMFLRVPVPVGYEKLLETQYGDWRTPLKDPTMHGGVVFRTDISYKEYLAFK